MTFGELADRLEGMREREERHMQLEAMIAYQQVGLIAGALAGERAPDLYEAFPLWSEEEIRQMKLEKYRRIMARYAAAKGGKSHGRTDPDGERQ